MSDNLIDAVKRGGDGVAEGMTKTGLPLWEDSINAFEEAVRRVECCECESMPCEHVMEWRRTRAELRDLYFNVFGDGINGPLS